MNNELVIVIKTVKIQERVFPIQTNKHFSELYDQFYNIGDKIIKHHNPCGDGEACNYAFCCDGCDYLQKDIGCSVKCITCKLWLCNKANISDDVREELWELVSLVRYFLFNKLRASKQDVFKYMEESKYTKQRLRYIKSKYDAVRFIPWKY